MPAMSLVITTFVFRLFVFCTRFIIAYPSTSMSSVFLSASTLLCAGNTMHRDCHVSALLLLLSLGCTSMCQMTLGRQDCRSTHRTVFIVSAAQSRHLKRSLIGQSQRVEGVQPIQECEYGLELVVVLISKELTLYIRSAVYVITISSTRQTPTQRPKQTETARIRKTVRRNCGEKRRAKQPKSLMKGYQDTAGPQLVCTRRGLHLCICMYSALCTNRKKNIGVAFDHRFRSFFHSLMQK